MIFAEKGRCLQSPSPEISTLTCLVLYQECKVSTSFRIVDFSVPSNMGTKDTSHAFFVLRKLIISHVIKVLCWLTAARELCYTIATKKPRAQVSGLSLLAGQRKFCFTRDFTL